MAEWNVTLLFMREGSLMVAQCLEYDVVAQGEDFDDALCNWGEVFSAHILSDLKKGREPLSEVKPAPQFYFDLVPYSKRVIGRDVAPLPGGVPMKWRIVAVRAYRASKQKKLGMALLTRKRQTQLRQAVNRKARWWALRSSESALSWRTILTRSINANLNVTQGYIDVGYFGV